MKKIAAITALLALLALTGCDKYNEPFKDAPTDKNRNSSPAQIIEMPDGFSNLASKCDGPNRIYVAYHEDKAFASITVAQNDPRCAESAG